MKLIKTYETLLVLFWRLLDNDSKSVLFLNDGWENHTSQASSHPIPLNLCSPPGQHPLAKVNYQPTLPHPPSVYKPPSAEKGRWFKAMCSCHLVNLMPRDPDQNCYGSKVTVWPLAYQSCVYFKSMCSNGQQQTERTQAMEQFGGRSCLGIQIRQVCFGVYSCWNVSIVTLNPGDDGLLCSGIL